MSDLSEHSASWRRLTKAVAPNKKVQLCATGEDVSGACISSANELMSTFGAHSVNDVLGNIRFSRFGRLLIRQMHSFFFTEHCLAKHFVRAILSASPTAKQDFSSEPRGKFFFQLHYNKKQVRNRAVVLLHR